MYKYLLCWRYLRTRYIALASVISVMLGVATMIVVNSVMAGFSEKMRDRLHGVLADLVVESASMDGFDRFEDVMARLQEAGGRRHRRHGSDHGDAGHSQVSSGQRLDDANRADHRRATHGTGQDGRFRRVPLRREG